MGQSGPSRNYPDTARLLLRPVNENLAFDDKGLRLCANAGVDADQCAGSDPVLGLHARPLWEPRMWHLT